jgi:small subunit ribosomal protein S21
MIIIEVKKEESIERALKRYKKKHKRVRITKELRERSYFTKKSVKRRKEVMNAAYREKNYGDHNN